MARRLSISAEQLRAIDIAAMALPIESRTMLKFHVIGSLEMTCGLRAVSDTDIDLAINRALKIMPVPTTALLSCDA